MDKLTHMNQRRSVQAALQNATGDDDEEVVTLVLVPLEPFFRQSVASIGLINHIL
jgi:hypothetical protein